MLNNNALLTVDELLVYIQKDKSDYSSNFLNIYNSSGDASAATVQITSTQIILKVTGGVNQGTSTLTLADADKDTLTELAAAITALSKGWIVNILIDGNQSSTDLYVKEETGCLLSANEITLDGFSSLYLETLINASSNIIERFCNRNFIKQTYTDLPLDGKRGFYLFLPNYPILSLTKLESYDPYTQSGIEMTENVDFLVYDAEGEGYLYNASRWTEGHKNYRITYEAGYLFADLPEDLKNACSMLINKTLNMTGKEGIKSERIGDYSITFDLATAQLRNSLTPEIEDILTPFKRFNVA